MLKRTPEAGSVMILCAGALVDCSFVSTERACLDGCCSDFLEARERGRCRGNNEERGQEGVDGVPGVTIRGKGMLLVVSLGAEREEGG